MNTSWRAVLTTVTVFLVVAVLYFPTLRGEFVYDSIAQVLYSDYIHTPSHWVDVFTLRVVGQDELDRNRPLLLVSLMLDAAIWGKNPFGYRLTNVLLHALNAALLFAVIATVVLRRMSVAGDGGATAFVAAPSPPAVLLIAAFGALVFALHPLAVEAIAEPSNREDLLVLLPMLTGLLFIVTERSRSLWVTNTFLILASFFAVLAKESGVAVPFVFAVACWLFGSLRRFLLGLVGGAVAVGAFLAASFLWRPQQSGIFVSGPAPLAEGGLSFLSVQARIWTLQLQQILWPSNLSAHYAPRVLENFELPLAAGVLALVFCFSVVVGRRNPVVALGVAIYLLTLLPASNFAPQFHPVADRYLYVPLSGVGMIAAALGAFFGRFCNSRAGVILFGATCVATISLEYAANLRRQRIWSDPEPLWRDVAEQYPRLALPQVGLANVHYRRGEFVEAYAAISEAVLYSGGQWDDAIALKAVCAWSAGKRGAALQAVADLTTLSPDYDVSRNPARLAWLPAQAKALEEVFREFERKETQDRVE
jgi:hypothetical protein